MKGFGVFLLVIGIICALAVNMLVGIGLAILGGILIIAGQGASKAPIPTPGGMVEPVIICPKGHQHHFSVVVPALDAYQDINSLVTVVGHATCSVKDWRTNIECGESLDTDFVFPHPAQQKPYVAVTKNPGCTIRKA